MLERLEIGSLQQSPNFELTSSDYCYFFQHSSGSVRIGLVKPYFYRPFAQRPTLIKIRRHIIIINHNCNIENKGQPPLIPIWLFLVHQ